MICLDCWLEDNLLCTCDYSGQHLGDVCPRCDRVWSSSFPKGNKHYATQKGYLARMQKDLGAGHAGVEKTATIKNLLRPFDG